MDVSALRLSISVLLLAVAAAPAAAVKGLTPIPVVPSVSLEDADWMPLPSEDVRRAVGDAALSRLSDAGRLHLLSGPATSEVGSLDLAIALTAPSQIAKLTMTLDVPGSPTVVSTASISLGDVKFRDLYGSLEHLGESAASRMIAKLDRVRAPQPDHSARKRVYDAGQAAKRGGQYEEARAVFEAVADSATDPQDVLRQLAIDELRYGLPVFEAQQALNTLGQLSRPGQELSRRVALARAENLYRQIQAENPYDVQRVSEAQRALDQIIVVRGALANAMRANMHSKLSGLRIGILEHTAMEGECPDRRQLRDIIENMRIDIRYEKASRERNGGRLYELSDPESGERIGLRCGDYRVEIIDLEGAPAASR